MSHVTHMNEPWHTYEPCHTYELAISHIWIQHLTHMNESCHTYETGGVIQTPPHHTARVICECVTHVSKPCHTYEWAMSHTWMCHATHMYTPCHIYEWVMSHIWNRWCIQCVCVCVRVWEREKERERERERESESVSVWQLTQFGANHTQASHWAPAFFVLTQCVISSIHACGMQLNRLRYDSSIFVTSDIQTYASWLLYVSVCRGIHICVSWLKHMLWRGSSWLGMSDSFLCYSWHSYLCVMTQWYAVTRFIMLRYVWLVFVLLMAFIFVCHNCKYGCICMHACIYACMYVCMYVCLYVGLYVCMHVCMHIPLYARRCVSILRNQTVGLCKYVRIHIYIHMRIYVNTCVYINIYICIYMRIYMYIYKYIHICACMYI